MKVLNHSGPAGLASSKSFHAARPLPFHPAAAPAQRSCKQTQRHAQPVRAQTQESEASASSPAEESKRGAGRQTYRPASYSELVTDAVEAVKVALADGKTRMEVEFPALSDVDGYKGASDLYIDANIQLGIAAARQLHEGTGKRVHVLLPDETEYSRAMEMFKATLSLSEGVSLGHLMEKKPSVLAGLSSLLFFGASGNVPAPDGPAAQAAAAGIFLVLNCSTIELKDMEAYVQEEAAGRPVVAWNLELDTLRADLGLLGFPPKDLQYRFLSTFTPVFYIRQRDYSKSVAVAPFIINYSGCLFREWPGPWQVMLRQDNGVYACVAENPSRRYNLGAFKEELMGAMGLDTEGEGSAMAFLRRGYKTSTWWEDDEEAEESHAWRS